MKTNQLLIWGGLAVLLILFLKKQLLSTVSQSSSVLSGTVASGVSSGIAGGVAKVTSSIASIVNAGLGIYSNFKSSSTGNNYLDSDTDFTDIINFC